MTIVIFLSCSGLKVGVSTKGDEPDAEPATKKKRYKGKKKVTLKPRRQDPEDCETFVICDESEVDEDPTKEDRAFDPDMQGMWMARKPRW